MIKPVPLAAAALLLVVLAITLVLVVGDNTSTDPDGAKSCEELIDRSARVAERVLRDIAGKQTADLNAENPADPWRPLVRPFEPFEARGRELGCDAGELRRLACRTYDKLEATGPAAEEFLAAFMQTCR